jgi:hypothetical protein
MAQIRDSTENEAQRAYPVWGVSIQNIYKKSMDTSAKLLDFIQKFI